MSDEKKTTNPRYFKGSAIPNGSLGRVTHDSSAGNFVNRRPTIGDQQVRSQDSFVTRNAAPPPVSDIPARPKGK